MCLNTSPPQGGLLCFYNPPSNAVVASISSFFGDQRHRFEQAQLRRTRQHHRNKEQGFVLQDCTVTGL
jgi:hypothetical protein